MLISYLKLLIAITFVLISFLGKILRCKSSLESFMFVLLFLIFCDSIEFQLTSLVRCSALFYFQILLHKSVFVPYQHMVWKSLKKSYVVYAMFSYTFILTCSFAPLFPFKQIV